MHGPNTHRRQHPPSLLPILLPISRRQDGRDHATHRIADDDGLVDAEEIQQAEDVVGDRLDRVLLLLLVVVGRASGAVRVEGDAAVGGQEGEDGEEVVLRGAEAVDEDDGRCRRWCFCGGGFAVASGFGWRRRSVGVVELAPVDGRVGHVESCRRREWAGWRCRGSRCLSMAVDGSEVDDVPGSASNESQQSRQSVLQFSSLKPYRQILRCS